MKTLDEWMQEHGEEYIDKVKEDIQNIENIPQSTINSLHILIEESEFEILENIYNSQLSDYEDMKYQEYKERDI